MEGTNDAEPAIVTGHVAKLSKIIAIVYRYGYVQILLILAIALMPAMDWHKSHY